MTQVKEVNIYHLYHSGVAVQTSNHFLIFDYYNDETLDNQERSLDNGVIPIEILKTEDNTLVFVSHEHSDHYNPIVFDWENYNQEINYILSDDIEVAKEDNYHKLSKYQELKLEDVYIETYGTTDQGVSFYIEVDGLNIFHSGDLNWWHWNKFTPEEQKQEEADYKAELDRLKGKNIDVAFVPVDHRLEEHYYLAAKYFAETINPELIVPIHFRDNYYVTTDFKKEFNDLSVDFVEIKDRGQKIIFEMN
ncbi:MBL fold metallo-hydrolase [Selenihalanaerobacter shriftii]|uniref:L-ascorbate metabolism protein UlaG, beta-lactamase superfamily n=1 Tax=Selenihalanaerobacter shriftii TaxID=142842 RepID=A0A1T4NG82_9FIRM|nr:MBL fold metallo-hydrolase [Selenihalanaerobacter shriftii]SJZ78280.1 L-ascorbate metabolism protein UlaG, beta-lactamase superfamily [Selenihalanaerobacter shriftii]